MHSVCDTSWIFHEMFGCEWTRQLRICQHHNAAATSTLSSAITRSSLYNSIVVYVCIQTDRVTDRTAPFVLTFSRYELVMLRYIENIDSISIYCIVSYRLRKYRNFRYNGIDFFDIHGSSAEFSRVWCQEVVKFSLNFSLWENFVKFYKYYLLVRISKVVISRRGPCLSSIC